MEQYYQLFISYLTLLSLITYAVYFLDKVKAKNGDRRISEKALLSLSFFGGAIGGILAMYTIRHKTKHWYFTVINLVSIGLHIGILIYLITLA